MSKPAPDDRTQRLGEVFVAVTGDDTVTEDREEAPSKRPIAGEDDDFEGVEDGLEDAVGGELDADGRIR